MFEPIINDFNKDYPNVKISYDQIPEENYEQSLIDALAAGNGPDIFMFRSDWMRKHMNKVISAPEDILSAGRFGSLFPQVAVQDFVSGNAVYASPLYVDTLALYYNRNIFDRKNIAIPPNTWEGFKNAISRGVAASFGGYAPLVARSGDIMNALFMQANADLSLQNKSFVRLSEDAGITALNLYTSVKAPVAETYAGFANETLGMIIDYESARKIIQDRNPFLNFSVAMLPQLDTGSPVVPAKYYGLAVSTKSVSPTLAWEFVSYVTTNASAAESYLNASNHPPALRSFIQSYSGDPIFGVFAAQALIARSWNMPASENVFTIFNTMIQSVVSGGASVKSALTTAETAINNLVR